MSLKTIITSATVAVVTAGSLVPMSSSASARDFDRHGGGYGGGYGKSYGRHFDGPRHGGGNYNAWQAPRRHRDHTGRNVAIGAFAAILGLAIASEASRNQNRYYEDRD